VKLKEKRVIHSAFANNARYYLPYTASYYKINTSGVESNESTLSFRGREYIRQDFHRNTHEFDEFG